MAVGKKYRGAFDQCLERYIEDQLAGREDLDLGRIFVTPLRGGGSHPTRRPLPRCTASSPSGKSSSPPQAAPSPATAAPGTIGVLFVRKD